MKQDTKEYIDAQLGELAATIRTEIGDIAQGIHERIGAVERDLDAVKRHTDAHCRLGANNAEITNALFGDVQRRLGVLDKMAGISSEGPQLDAELADIDRRYVEAEQPVASPLSSFSSLLDFLASGPGQSGIFSG